MRTAHLLTVSRSIASWGDLPNPPDVDPPHACRTPLDADPLPLVMWPVMHGGKPPPL